MNIRYGKAFRIPRKIAKHFFSFIYPLVIKIFPLPKVKSIDDTLDKLIEGKYSICRYGDGDFQTMIDKIDLPYQKYDAKLGQRMKEIIVSNEPNILIGLPIGYHSIKGLVYESRLNWRSQLAWVYPRLRKYLDLNKQYYNASMSRFYYEYEDKNISKGYLEKLLQLWEGKHVLLIVTVINH